MLDRGCTSSVVPRTGDCLTINAHRMALRYSWVAMRGITEPTDVPGIDRRSE